MTSNTCVREMGHHVVMETEADIPKCQFLFRVCGVQQASTATSTYVCVCVCNCLATKVLNMYIGGYQPQDECNVTSFGSRNVITVKEDTFNKYKKCSSMQHNYYYRSLSTRPTQSAHVQGVVWIIKGSQSYNSYMDNIAGSQQLTQTVEQMRQRVECLQREVWCGV